MESATVNLRGSGRLPEAGTRGEADRRGRVAAPEPPADAARAKVGDGSRPVPGGEARATGSGDHGGQEAAGVVGMRASFSLGSWSVRAHRRAPLERVRAPPVAATGESAGIFPAAGNFTRSFPAARRAPVRSR
ncbi:hypothetical protein GCM10010466_11650 [Planomonospora alba]|uniref:Uncharacterized protein n=1 Tax=Planomonospora alba TaxID=161354 RepID=A0ABP6MR65_9ACTN